MPDLSEDFIKELIGNKDKEPAWLKPIADRLAALEEKIVAKPPENTPPIVPPTPTPLVPENTPPVPENKNPPQFYTFQRRGRGLKLVQPKEKEQQPTSKDENKDKNSSGSQAAS